jgi:5'-nucleotidase
MSETIETLATLALASGIVTIAHLRARALQRSHRFLPETEILISPFSSYIDKREKVIKGGSANLHIVLDFDRTMTTYFGPNGGRGATCHGIVEARRSKTLKERADALNAIFYPIEIDPKRSQESKLPWMRAWYALVNEILIESGLKKSDIIEDVKQANCSLRKGITEILEWAQEKSVPITIFSAGLGDVIVAVLEQHWRRPLPSNLKIISNMMTFDENDGCLNGFSDNLIHMFNKSMIFHKHDPAFNELSSRKNVLLLGDSTADVTMADGLDADTILRVGFLNDNIKNLAETYMSLYDVVLTNDSSATLVVELLTKIS